MLSSKDKPESESMPQPPHATTQKGRRAGLESEMEEKPIPDKLEEKGEDPMLESYKASGKLEGRSALVTGEHATRRRSMETSSLFRVLCFLLIPRPFLYIQAETLE